MGWTLLAHKLGTPGGEAVWRRVPWGRIRRAGIVVGVAAASLFEYLLTRFVVFSMIFPYLNGIFEESGSLAQTGRNAALYEEALSGLSSMKRSSPYFARDGARAALRSYVRRASPNYLSQRLFTQPRRRGVLRTPSP